MMSAGRTRPDSRRTPDSVTAAMRSVTISTSLRRTHLSRSAPGIAQMRWSHGSYGGVRCGRCFSSASLPPSASSHASLRRFFTMCGYRRASLKSNHDSKMCRKRTSWIVHATGNSTASFMPKAYAMDERGMGARYDGVRWSITTLFAPAAATAGTMVTAVAPLPTTTMSLPSTDVFGSQNCGWTISPLNCSWPGNVGQCGASYL
mmetsp:Transcript_14335/g.44531  ORF Transcript_14335/g.44531 Transcript_14335/m.44531 type:complete len:204 (-) Transcript_14335:333-944(-)